MAAARTRLAGRVAYSAGCTLNSKPKVSKTYVGKDGGKEGIAAWKKLSRWTSEGRNNGGKREKFASFSLGAGPGLGLGRGRQVSTT